MGCTGEPPRPPQGAAATRQVPTRYGPLPEIRLVDGGAVSCSSPVARRRQATRRNTRGQRQNGHGRIPSRRRFGALTRFAIGWVSASGFLLVVVSLLGRPRVNA